MSATERRTPTEILRILQQAEERARNNPNGITKEDVMNFVASNEPNTTDQDVYLFANYNMSIQQ